MTAGARHLAALSVTAALLLPAGCGSSDDEKGKPLPGDAVAALNERLDEVQRRYDDGVEHNNPGACQDIENDSYKAIDSTVEGLPDDVDQDVRDALEESLARLQDLTREGCSGVKETRTEEETAPEETVPPETVTETVPPPPPTETETVPQEKPKKDKTKNGNGNGNGGGTESPGTTGGAAPQAGEG